MALGYNFRMSSITAALGIAQMKKIEKIIKMRNEVAAYYGEKLSNIGDLVPIHVPDGAKHVYQLFTVRVRGGKTKRDRLIAHLAENGVASKVYFEPVHLTKFYREKFGYRGGELPVTEAISSEVLSLPIHPTLSKKEIDLIVERIGDFFRGDRN